MRRAAVPRSSRPISEWQPTPPNQPAPPQQINAFPRLDSSGGSYASRAATSKGKGKAPQAPRTDTPPAANLQCLTAAQLADPKTTKAQIIAHAAFTFGAKLAISKTRSVLVQEYTTLAFNRQVPGVAATKNTTTTPRPKRPVTTIWTVRHRTGAASLEWKRPFDGNPIKLVQQIQTDIRQAAGNPNPPLTLLGGHWSSSLASNFVLVFAGRPSNAQVLQYRTALTKQFPSYFHLAPRDGFTKVMFHGVPCIRKPDGSLQTPYELRVELGQNIPLRQFDFVDEPSWSHTARTDETHEISSFSMIFIDKDNKLTGALRQPCYMHGKRITPWLAPVYTLARQCDRCHFLNHSTTQCPRPDTYTRCGLCGRTGHVADQHHLPGNCRVHNTIRCNCPATCFNCLHAKKPAAGHYAMDDGCPLKKNMRHPIGTAPPTRAPLQFRQASVAPPPVRTTPPTPPIAAARAAPVAPASPTV